MSDVKCYGKYRALVVNNKDPENMARVKVMCPSVLGDYESAWCLPCVPIAYDDGGMYYVPSVGEVVWVEFEEGNPSKPIYTGSWWIPNRSPQQKNNSKKPEEKIVFISRCGNILEFNDVAKTVIIKTEDGSRIKIGGKQDIEINATPSTKVVVYGNLVLGNDVTISGNASVKGELTVNGDIKHKGTITKI